MSYIHITNKMIKEIVQAHETAIMDNNITKANMLKNVLSTWINQVFDGTRDCQDELLLCLAVDALVDTDQEVIDDVTVDREVNAFGDIVNVKSVDLKPEYHLNSRPYCGLQADDELDINDPDFDPTRQDLPDCCTCKDASDGHCDGVDPENCGLTADDTTADYFNQARGHSMNGAGDVSRDDQNRHLRESRLGYQAPTADWQESHRVIRCIFPHQVITRPIDRDNEFLLFAPAITHLDVYYNRVAAPKTTRQDKIYNELRDNPYFDSCQMCHYSGQTGRDEPCKTCTKCSRDTEHGQNNIQWIPGPDC